jgi:DNA helicase II / ATP-dependent DNA helicase PcrA
LVLFAVTLTQRSLTFTGGYRFFDRLEVKIILDYLRVINQPDNNDALARIINVPSRRIGDATVKSLLDEADQSSITLWTLILDNAQGTKNTNTKLAKLTEQGLSSFVNIILTARKKFLESTGSRLSITELIDHIIKKISFEDFLERSHPEDHESRWANIEELINQASDYTDLVANGYEDDEALPEVDGLQQDDQSNPLSRFLANIALASDVKAIDASAPQPQVTISTIHAAKGLEWPIVFIPAAYEGSIPHSRAEDADEERRLLYVAMTRAKALLYLSYPMKNSQREQTTISPFLAPSSLKPFLDDKGPSFGSNLIQSIAMILNRPFPLNIDSEGLPSLEDDLWPINGEEVDEDGRKWDGSDGNPHYTQGQRPAKRQRIDDGPNTSTSTRETWQPIHITTMDQGATFSTESATLKSGFISAGSHLKVLSEKSINCAADKSVPLFAKVTGTNLGISEEKIGHRKLGKPSASRNIRGSEEQKNIASFFIMPKQPPRKLPDNASASRKFPPNGYPNDAQSTGVLSSFGSAAEDSGILPSLANHRLGSAKLSAPSRHQVEESGVQKKPYVCFSSSPSRPEILVKEAEATSAVMSIEFNIIQRSQPAKTMHTTTMSHMNTLPRKSLGVRRDLKGWANRTGQGFVVPSMTKRPC